MAINTRPSLINDGGSTRKKKNQYTTGGKTSGSGAGRGSSSGNKNSSSKKKATTEDLIAAIKKGAQTVSNIGGSMSPNTAVASGAKVLSQTAKSLPTWQSLTTKRNIYPQQPTAKFITTASDVNDYYQKLQISSKAVKDLENDLNEKKRQLSQLSVGIGAAAGSLGKITPDYLNYQEKVKEYNQQLQNYQRAVDEANKNAKDYQNALMDFSGDSSGMTSAVRSDYETLKKANDKARSQAYVDTKNQLESQKSELQAKLEQISKSTKSSIDSGMGNAQSQLDSMKSLNAQIDDIDKNLSIIENYAKAKRTENVAKQDPKFEEYVAEGEKKLEQYFRMSSGTGIPEWYRQYQNMDEEQKKVYAYLTGKNSASRDATEYLNSISAEVNQKIASDLQKSQQKYAQEHPVKAGITSVLAQPYAAITTLGEALGGIGGDKFVDPNTAGARLQQGIQTYRSEGLNQIENPVLNTLAQAGYSVADMLPAVGLTALAGPAAGGAYMGVLQGTGSYNEAVQRGLTRNQALAYGTTSAVVSSALESVGLDEIGKAFAGGKNGATQLLRGIVGSIVSEGSEEAAENVAQLIYDDIIAGEKSNVNLAKKQYMAQGMSEKDAEIQAWKDVGLDTLNSFIVGGLAGGSFAAVGGGLNAAANYEGRPNISYNALTELGLSEDAAKALVDAQRPEIVNALQQSAKQFNVPEEVSSRIEALSNDTNTKVVFDGSLKDGESGFYNPSTQEIHLNPNINNTTIIFSHELTHSLENTSAYNKLSELVLSQIQDIDKVRQDKISLYKEHGIELDSDGVDAEVVAEYVSNKLFSDQEAIQRVANYDLSLAGRIKNWISRMAAKVTGKKDKEFLLKAESLYAKAIQEAKTITDMRTANSLARSFKVDGNTEQNIQNALNNVYANQRVYYSVNETTPQTPGQEQPVSTSEATATNDTNEVKSNAEVSAENQEQPPTAKAETVSSERKTSNTKYEEQVKEYGSIPEGEEPRAREVNVPQSTTGEDKVRRFTRTEMEASATPEDMISRFEDEVSKGTFSYKPQSQKKVLEDQIKYIQENGFEEALKQWSGAVKRGAVDSKTMVLGQVLYSEAAKAGDTELAMNLAAELAVEGTNLGQAVSSMRLLKRLTPEGKLYYAQKSVEKLKQELKDKLGDKAPDLEINDKLADDLMNAKTQEEIDKASIALYQDIANQTPNTWMDKWDAWRYLAMLGNPRTHIRNIVGNVLFGNKLISLRSFKNLTGAVLESGADKLNRLMGGQGIERTKSITTRKVDRTFAKEDFKEMKGVLTSEGKYTTTSGIKALKTNPFSGGVLGKTKLDKPLNALSAWNSKALEREDTLFLKSAYVDSMAQYMKANKLSPEDMKGATLEKARTYAVKEAQKATFRDASALASWLNKNISHSNIKGVRLLGGGLLPFTKTPVNIVKRGIEYSPIGVLNGVKQAAVDVRKGTKTASEAIDTLSSGLTGSGILALGVWMASQGLLVGGDDENNKKQTFDEMTGSQSYALDLSPLGLPFTYTIDWAAPTALPLFVGVEIWNALQNSEEGTLTGDKVIEALADITEPVFNLTMLDGINSAIQSAAYAEGNPFTSIFTSMFTDYFTQGVPTLLGQVNRSFFDKTRRTTYVDPESPVPEFLSRALQSAQMKIPGLSNMMNPYQDAFGREQSNGSWWENFFSPGYIEKKTDSPAEKAIQELYEATGDASIFPSKPQKSITVNGKTRQLSAQEYTQYVQDKGSIALNALNELVSSKSYKDMDDNARVAAINDIYDYAGQLAKANLSEYKPDSWITKMEWLVKNGVSLGDAIAFKGLSSGKDSNSEKSEVLLNMDLSPETKRSLFEAYVTDSRAEETDAILDSGVSFDEFLQAQISYGNINSEKDLKASEKAMKFSAWVDEQGFTEDQQTLLKDSFAYFSVIPVKNETYDKLTSTGMESDVALGIAELLSGLNPEEGQDSVTNAQKYYAIATSDYTEENKLKALSQVMDDSHFIKLQRAMGAGASLETYADLIYQFTFLEPEEGNSSVTDNQKYKMIAESEYSSDEKLAVLYGIMDDKQYEKIEEASNAGIDLETYFQYRIDSSKIESDKDQDGKMISGSKKQKTMTYIDSLDLTSDQKDQLYRENGWAESTLNEAPWHGGASYEGEVFTDSNKNNVHEALSNQSNRVTQSFKGSAHSGTDIGYTYDENEPVHSTESGKVIWVQTGYGNAPGSSGNASYGNLVQIQYEDGRTALYAHLSAVNVSEGDIVQSGQQIGNMGNTGNSYGSHLHFELRDANGNLMDSTAYLTGEASPSTGGVSVSGSSSGETSGSSSTNSSSGGSSKKTGSSKGSSSKTGTSGSAGKIPSSIQRISSASSSSRRLSLPTVSGPTIKRTSSRTRSLSLPTVNKIGKQAISSNKTGINVVNGSKLVSRNTRSTFELKKL